MPADESFQERVKKLLKAVPAGKVVTYGALAAYAGSPRAARQVVWILNSCAEKERLPWHRVINAQGKISLGRGRGYEMQREMLWAEGIEFGKGGYDRPQALSLVAGAPHVAAALASFAARPSNLQPVLHLAYVLRQVPASVGEDAVIRPGHSGCETNVVGVEEPLLCPATFDRLVEQAAVGVGETLRPGSLQQFGRGERGLVREVDRLVNQIEVTVHPLAAVAAPTDRLHPFPT